MNKLITTLFLIFIQYSLSAQNITMAKAFYKEAQQEYENKNYQEAINLIEKTKENLNGDTNPDIIYLEAKSRYENDLNINKAKSLFKQFLEEADGNDDRISEVSNILVKIESSKNYYSNGNIKVKTQIDGINKTIIYYNDTGYYYKFEEYLNNEIQRIVHYSYTEETYKQVANLDYTTNAFFYLQDDVAKLYSYSIKPTKFKDINKTLKLGDQDLSVNIKFPIESPKQILFRYKGNLVQSMYMLPHEAAEGLFKLVVTVYKSFNTIDNNEKAFEINYIKYENEIKLDDNIGFHENGLIKYIKNGSDKYLMEENGLPSKKEVYKRGKLKRTYTYNKTTNDWIQN